MTIHLAFELHHSPTRPTATGQNEIAINNFPVAALGDEKRKGLHGVAVVGSNAASAPSFVKACCGGGTISAMVPLGRDGWHHANLHSRGASQREEKKTVGAVEQTTISTINRF